MKKCYKDETQSILAFKCKTTINNLPVLNLNHQDEVQKFNSNTCSSCFTTEHSHWGHTDTHTVFFNSLHSSTNLISFYALLEKFDQTGYALFVCKMLSFQYVSAVPNCSISDIGFDIENYCTYFIILGLGSVFLKYDFKMNCARVQHSQFSQCYICIYVFASSFQFPTGPIEPEAENVTIPETWFASFTWYIMIQCTQKRNRIE